VYTIYSKRDKINKGENNMKNKKQIKKDLGAYKKLEGIELQNHLNDVKRGTGKHKSKKDYTRKIKHKQRLY